MEQAGTAEPEVVTHVVYDPDSGRILGTLRHDAAGSGHEHGATEGEGCRCHEDTEALEAFVDEGWEAAGRPHPRLADAPPRLEAPLAELRVDPRSRRLVPVPRLVVEPERAVLEGDGEDAIAVEIRAVDQRGAVVEDFSGEVHVTVGRGKLSARGGTVRLEGGRGTVRLTSVRETVDHVPLAVTAEGGAAAAATATVAFA